MLNTNQRFHNTSNYFNTSDYFEDKNAGRRGKKMRQKDVKVKAKIVYKCFYLLKYVIDHTNV